MPQFVSEPVVVELSGVPAVPESFTWRGTTLKVSEVLAEWQDWGFGATHPAARNWKTRRHRNYYRVRAVDGKLYELYLDRGSGRRRWYLYQVLD